MNAQRLKAQCLSHPDQSLVALCTDGDVVVGHAFATLWKYKEDLSVCWITQLVVSSPCRKKAIATTLLSMIPASPCQALGLVSSHPAACLALVKCASAKIRKLNLNYIKDMAPVMRETTPITYLKSSVLRGSIFEGENAEAGVLCSVFTDFLVDHVEPLAALSNWEADQDMSWPLGVLVDGHEYIVIVKIGG